MFTLYYFYLQHNHLIPKFVVIIISNHCWSMYVSRILEGFLFLMENERKIPLQRKNEREENFSRWKGNPFSLISHVHIRTCTHTKRTSTQPDVVNNCEYIHLSLLKQDTIFVSSFSELFASRHKFISCNLNFYCIFLSVALISYIHYTYMYEKPNIIL